MGLFTAEIKLGMYDNYKVKIVERVYDHNKTLRLKHCIKEITVDIRNGHYLIDTIKQYLSADYLDSVNWIGNTITFLYLDSDKNKSTLIDLTYKKTNKEA